VSAISYRLDDALRQRVEQNLERFTRRGGQAEGLRPAAVALVLTADDTGEAGEACFVLTRRAPKLRRHAGQWALPGGRLDPGETPVQAALRELHEEVGLDLPAGSTLGLLDDYATRSGFAITPVVMWGGPSCTLVPDKTEVAEVYRVPLRDLDHPSVPRLRSIPESDRPVISISLLGANIHAPTAAILYQLREVAIWGRDTRVAHYEQPLFAWK
jgi:8-oxo-dGTP pyrophosphatase MutT (NUDIX family)